MDGHIVIDARNLLDRVTVLAQGLTYLGIGIDQPDRAAEFAA